MRCKMEDSHKPETILYNSKKLQEDLHVLGMKIKHHEDNIKFLKSHKNKLDDSILDLQVTLGKYHSSTMPNNENDAHYSNQSEDETMEQILQHEKSGAGILCRLKMSHGTQISHLSFTNDVLGVVATLGKVDDDNLGRLFSEYLGVETMLAIVCKTYEGVKALETYDKEGQINKDSGLHGLGASNGKELDGRFLVFCLENLRHESQKSSFVNPVL
ncbi:protein DEFECTIVE IN MERISTEM SILENCING 3-like [Populus alba x Populus x berolinensis]|uniref:Protein DEFECTIVE IN MERISTEM SILENCING 3-like n=1 Tax=Populus alba x Populus x berolinensis TaxID=444605 RepID=A0AAD6LPK0_9ROSI|nr:protein DEFECTIVE IN MERISTEM SILENCING 3-like [Populus alba x Populus x berolinensis]